MARVISSTEPTRPTISTAPPIDDQTVDPRPSTGQEQQRTATSTGLAASPYRIGLDLSALHTPFINPVAAATAVTTIAASVQSQAVEIVRRQNLMYEQVLAPAQSILQASAALSQWWNRQESILQSVVTSWPWGQGYGLGWNTDLWPTDGLLRSVWRSLDVLRPQLLDLSRMLDSIFDASRWIGSFHLDVWRELRTAGARVAFWAVWRARAALDHDDFATKLQPFIRIWLDAAPTPARVEALVEALLLTDLSEYGPETGHELLANLRDTVVELNTARRREHETLLGLRRGAGSIARIAHPEATVLHRPGSRGGPTLEDSVLDRLVPDVDPRLVELVNGLPPQDRKIAMLKIVTGVGWSAAAVSCDVPAARGEVIGQWLRRRRKALDRDTAAGAGSAGPAARCRSGLAGRGPDRPGHRDVAMNDPMVLAAAIPAVGLVLRGILIEMRWWWALRGSTPTERPPIIEALHSPPAARRPR